LKIIIWILRRYFWIIVGRNMAKDPVCGMIVNEKTGIHSEMLKGLMVTEVKNNKF
jgi:hypothetical protein